MSGETKIIDTKLPLTWLLSTAGALLAALLSLILTIANQSGKIDQVISQTTKFERRLDERDARMDRIEANIFEIRRKDDLQDYRLEALDKFTSRKERK